MRYAACLLIFFSLSLCSLAQIPVPSTKQCTANTLDRTIHLCDPGGSTLPTGTTMRAYAASSAGITSFQLWMDGVKKYDTALDRYQPDKGSMFTSIPANETPTTSGKWHRFVFIAKDSKGEFRNAVYYFLIDSIGAHSPCTPSQDQQIKICNDLKDGDTVTSPLSLTFAAKASTFISGMGVSSEDLSNGGSYVGFVTDTTGVAGGSTTLHLPRGAHTLRFIAGSEDHEFTKFVRINVR